MDKQTVTPSAKSKKTKPAMESEPKFKRVTLRELFEHQKPIWVINSTGRPDGKYPTPGNVVMQIGSGDNIDRLTVPPGNDPVCLSDQTDYTSLKECRDLFKLIRSGVLELLNPEKAEEYYSIHEGRRSIMEKKVEDYLHETKREVPQGKVEASVVQINGRITQTCLQLKHGAITERNALEQLIENSTVFSADDLSYLLSNGKFNSIKSWAKDQLKKFE